MKKYLLMIFATLLMSGCASMHDEADAVAVFSPEELADIELIASMGYDVSEVERFHEGYLVEEYIWITQDLLQEWRDLPPQTRLTKYETGSWVPVSVQSNLRIYFMNQSGSNHNMVDLYNYLNSNSLGPAVDAWNSIPNCNIKISYNSGSTTIPINIYDYTWFNNSTAKMMVVEPGSRTVNINGSAILNIHNTPLQANYFLMHCIGHALGFGHTGGGTTSGLEREEQIEGTADTDSGSIMNKEKSSLAWSGISKQDKIDIAKVYPVPANINITYSPSGSNLSTGTTYRFTATSAISDVGLAYEVSRTGGLTSILPGIGNGGLSTSIQDEVTNSSLYEITEISNGVADIKFLQAGNYKVKVSTTTLVNNASASIDVAVSGAPITITVSPDDATKVIERDYTFTATSSNSSATYSWTVKKGTVNIQFANVSNGKIKLQFPSAGEYTVTASAGGSSKSMTVNIVNPTITITPSVSDKVYTGMEVEYTATSNHPSPTYTWTVKKGSAIIDYINLSNGKIKILFPSAGTYTITAMIGTVTKSITVNVVDYTIAITPSVSDKVYPGMEVEYTATSNHPSPTYTWTVKKGSAIIDYINLSNGKIKILFPSAGTYTITAMIGTVATKSITVNVVDYIISITPSSTDLSPGSECDFTVTSNHPNPTYTWTVKTEIADVHFTTVSNDKIKVLFPSAGTYLITAKIGTVATKTIMAVVRDGSLFSLSPDDDPLVANKTYTLTPNDPTHFIAGLKLYDLVRGTEIQPSSVSNRMAQITFPLSSTYRIEIKLKNIMGKEVTITEEVQVQ